MRLNPYLTYGGNCAEAFAFYETVLGGKIVMRMTNGDAPPGSGVTPGTEDKIMHIRMDVGGTVLMGSDAPASMFRPAQGMTVSLNIDDPAEAERVYAGLSEGGDISMPIAETFWAKRFAMFVDKFGIPWMINCEKTD